MPALVAVCQEPHLRACYQRLLGRGNAEIQALVAVMGKLLHAIFGRFKHRQPCDGSKLYRSPEEAPAGLVPLKLVFANLQSLAPNRGWMAPYPRSRG